jgi:hypothetical protein
LALLRSSQTPRRSMLLRLTQLIASFWGEV